jgi:hypothetical protein
VPYSESLRKQVYLEKVVRLDWIHSPMLYPVELGVRGFAFERNSPKEPSRPPAEPQADKRAANSRLAALPTSPPPTLSPKWPQIGYVHPYTICYIHRRNR